MATEALGAAKLCRVGRPDARAVFMIGLMYESERSVVREPSLHFATLRGELVSKCESPSSSLSKEDLQEIADVCCRLMARGRIQGVVRVEGNDDRIVCVSSNPQELVGIGKNDRGRYYVFNSDGSAVVEGWRLQDVIKALAAA